MRELDSSRPWENFAFSNRTFSISTAPRDKHSKSRNYQVCQNTTFLLFIFYKTINYKKSDFQELDQIEQRGRE